MGALAFWVRRGSRPAAVVSTVVTGFILVIVLVQLFFGGGGPQVLPALCVFCLPLVLLGATVKSLLEAMKNAPQIAIARSAPAAVPQPGVYSGGWAARPPAQGWEAPSYPTQPWPTAAPPNAPPPGQPPVRYGYAQAPAPSIPQPPPGDAPVGTSPAEAFPQAPAPDQSPDRANTDERSNQG